MNEADEEYYRKQVAWLNDDTPTPRAPLCAVMDPMPDTPPNNRSQHVYTVCQGKPDPQYRPTANPNQVPGGYIRRNGAIARGMYGRWQLTGCAYYRDDNERMRYLEYPVGKVTKFKYDLTVFNGKFWTYLCSTAWREGIIQEVIGKLNKRGLAWALVHAETGFVIEEGKRGSYGSYGPEPGGR